MSWQGIQDTLQKLAKDRARGARELALEAARAIAAVAPAAAAPPGAAPESPLRAAELARAVVDAQPEMAPFYHLAATLLASGGTARAIAERAAAFARKLEDESLERLAAGRIPPSAYVLTYSRSGSVVAALLAAHRAGKMLRVGVGEGRPGYEGRGVAAALAAAGVAVELVTDAALFGRVERADLVMIGADAVGRRNFANKVGTGALCVAARSAACPVYVLADQSKLLPEEMWPAFRERAADEVWPDAPAGVLVSNPYFEAIPLAGIEAVILAGEGVLGAGAVASKVDEAARALQPLARLLGEAPPG